MAGAERKAKEKQPQAFCKYRDCLWRLKTWHERTVGFCPRHEPQVSTPKSA